MPGRWRQTSLEPGKMISLSSPYHKAMPRLELDLSLEEWERLPRNASYDYLYVYGKAVLIPRQWTARALLELDPEREKPQSVPIRVRPLTAEDWSGLGSVFRSAFDQQLPFAGLPREAGEELVGDCLDRTRDGREGELLPSACLVAESQDEVVAAVLVTLLPGSRLHLPDRGQVPHLSWIFVSSSRKRYGIGAALLSEVVSRLLAAGYGQLASTFLVGNTESELWHWRMGFQLLPSKGPTGIDS